MAIKIVVERKYCNGPNSDCCDSSHGHANTNNHKSNVAMLKQAPVALCPTLLATIILAFAAAAGGAAAAAGAAVAAAMGSLSAGT